MGTIRLAYRYVCTLSVVIAVDIVVIFTFMTTVILECYAFHNMCTG